MPSRKHIRDLRRLIQSKGFTVDAITVRGGGHLQVDVSKGKKTSRHITSRSPSDHRSYLNLISEIRRAFK